MKIFEEVAIRLIAFGKDVITTSGTGGVDPFETPDAGLDEYLPKTGLEE